MAGWGSVLAQGLLGTVMGASSAAGKNAELEMKEEMERRRLKYLSDLRVQEHGQTSDIDIANIPKKGSAETGVAVERQDQMRPGIIETARQSGQVVEDVKHENAPRNAEDEAKRTTLVDSAKLPYRLAEIKAQGDNSIRVAHVAAEEALKRDWHAGNDGNYYDGQGKQIMTRVKIEGRGYEEVPVKVPDNKMQKDAKWMEKEELDSINKRIEAASKDPLVDDAKMAELQREKQRLMQRISGGAVAPEANAPWKRNWNK